MLPSSLLNAGDDASALLGITSESTLGDRAAAGLQVTLIGMSVVFGVLILLMAILYVFKLLAIRKTAAPAPAAAAAPASPVSDSEDDPVTVAVVTAAIAASRGESDCAFNVISIKKIVK